MSFLSYRVLVLDFQDKLIPEIFAHLYPVFLSVSKDFEMISLSLRQSKISLKEGVTSSDSFFSPFIKTIFKLLSEIINFRYSITASEFESL